MRRAIAHRPLTGRKEDSERIPTRNNGRCGIGGRQCLWKLSQFSVMQVDDHEAEEHQRFDEREAENQGCLNAVVSARIAGHAFTGRSRDATLANAAQSRRYSEAYCRADVAKP